MKNSLLILFVLVSGMAFCQEPEPMAYPDVTTKNSAPKDSVFTAVDEMAEFPGGTSAMMNFLAKTMHYPERAIAEELQGKCFLKFIVDLDGRVSNVKVMRGVPDCPECDQEAIRVVEAMPKWKPAKINGKAVKSVFNLPITFYLN